MKFFTTLVKKYLKKLLEYLYYNICYTCKGRTLGEVLCPKCVRKLDDKGYKRVRYVRGVRVEAYYSYDDEMKTLIRGVKYHNKTQLAPLIAKILSLKMADYHLLGGDVEIVPVPLHPNRQQERKYNHMELIAEELAEVTECGLNTELVARVKDTRPQYKLTERERRKNLKNAFKVDKAAYSGKKLVLLDDICTTGVTMEELINELKKNGIHNVTGLAVAFPGVKKY